MKREEDWPEAPGRGYRGVEAILGEDGLLRTLNSNGRWERWLPLKQAVETVAGLVFRLIVVGVCSFLLGMLAQWVKGSR